MAVFESSQGKGGDLQNWNLPVLWVLGAIKCEVGILNDQNTAL